MHRTFYRIAFLCALSSAITCSTNAQVGPARSAGNIGIMPLPTHMSPGNGSFFVDNGLAIVSKGYTEPRLERAEQRLMVTLARQTGILQWKNTPETRAQFVVEVKGPSAPVQEVGEDESYQLQISSDAVHLVAPNPLGVLRGFQTFLQLVHATPQGYRIEAMTIDDSPRFPWRGLMIDSGRHFMPPEIIRQNLDGMEAVKLNVLHWHVSEDQGFRIESKVFPKLYGMGSNGQYYTQKEVKDIIEYARDRGIRVYPEFEMPSHANSFYIGYPELSDGKAPYHLKRKFGEKWGRPRNASEDASMNPALESTYTFLNRFVAEMSALFPDKYWHMGGDGEDAMTEWATNPAMQRYMQQNHMKDTVALQAYFTNRVAKIISSHNKIPIGWDEVLQPGTPKDVAIQSWRGLDSLAQAAGSGHHAILSWGYYLDLNEPSSRHYAVDPIAKPVSDLPLDQQKLILGGETAMWTEYVSPETVDGRIWPRAAVVAERLWSGKEIADVQNMYARLPRLSMYLAARDLPFKANRERQYQRMAGDNPVEPLKVLASVLEPPKGFPREGDREYDVFTPLNHLSDIIPAESDDARGFLQLAARIHNGTATKAEFSEARTQLVHLRDNDAVLQPILRQNAVTQELIPVSMGVMRAAILGLAALDAMENNHALDANSRATYLAELKTLRASVAELTDMIVPGIEILITGSGISGSTRQ